MGGSDSTSLRLTSQAKMAAARTAAGKDTKSAHTGTQNRHEHAIADDELAL